MMCFWAGMCLSQTNAPLQRANLVLRAPLPQLCKTRMQGAEHTQTHFANRMWCMRHPVPDMTIATSSSFSDSRERSRQSSNLLACVIQLLLTFGGASTESQKTSSVGEKGDNGEMAISDIELLWGASRLERRLAFWENKRLTRLLTFFLHLYIYSFPNIRANIIQERLTNSIFQH